MEEKDRGKLQIVDLKIEDIDSSSAIVIEDSRSMTFMEFDYTTLTPMGQVMEIFLTFSCKIRGEIKKVTMDFPHFLVIYKNAKKKGIAVKKGEGYRHVVEDSSGKEEKTDFDVLDYLKRCITKEKDKVGDMFF